MAGTTLFDVRHAGRHRLAESMNRFLGSLNVYKYRFSAATLIFAESDRRGRLEWISSDIAIQHYVIFEIHWFG